jgi:hypothetical protein
MHARTHTISPARPAAASTLPATPSPLTPPPQILALVPLCMLISDGDAGRMWHRTTVYIIEMIASAGCVALAAYVLYGEGSQTHEPIKPAPGEPAEEEDQSPWERIKALANLFSKK